MPLLLSRQLKGESSRTLWSVRPPIPIIQMCMCGNALRYLRHHHRSLRAANGRVGHTRTNECPLLSSLFIALLREDLYKCSKSPNSFNKGYEATIVDPV